MIWRDLRVFAFLFMFGLVAWSTGLYSVIPGASAPILEQPVAEEAHRAPPSLFKSAGLNQQTRPIYRRDQPRLEREPERLPQLPARNAPDQGSSQEKTKSFSGKPVPDRVAGDDAITRIVIPALQLDSKVVYVPFDGSTWDIEELGENIAWLGDFSDDGLGANTVLAGHFSLMNSLNGPFRYLSRLSSGSLVILYTEERIFTYQVREFTLVEANDLSVLAPTSAPQLTLVTCETWDEETRSFLSRRIVFADLVKVESFKYGEIN